MKKLMSFKTKGMNQDLSVSAFNPEFSFENMNLRLSTNEHNTTLSWVNEKGTKMMTTDDLDNAIRILGVPVGTAVINHRLIIFTCDNTNGYETAGDLSSGIFPDHIYALVNDSHQNLTFSTLYAGNLNLNTSYPLETLVSYESNTIEKVYWVDGLNQPRVVNVATTKIDYQGSIANMVVDTQFDFVPGFSAPSSASVKKYTSGGTFAPGVIQYCFTYNYKYGQQSNIVWVSPLLYISPADRGGRPDENISNSFKITITAPDSRYDFIRIYSIQRTSIDAVPYVKMVTDIDIPSDANEKTVITYTDTGTTGSVIDSQQLLYIGGREIVARTMADKDQTLFLGNITQKNVSVPTPGLYYNEAEKAIYDADTEGNIKRNGEIYYEYNTTKQYLPSEIGGLYKYDFNLNDDETAVTTFKGGEWYRFGYQLQTKTGEWTQPIWIKDKQNDKYPDTNPTSTAITFAQTTLNLRSAFGTKIDNYIAIRPLIVYPNINDRSVLCQGVLNPTVFNAKDRMEGSVFAQSSWFFRPHTYDPRSFREDSFDPTASDTKGDKVGESLEFCHYAPLPQSAQYNASHHNPLHEDEFYQERRVEVQGAYNQLPYVLALDEIPTIQDLVTNTEFFVDQSIVTLHSPDIEFDTEVQSVSYNNNWKMRVLGFVPINSYASYHNITSGTIKYPRNYNADAQSQVTDFDFGTGELPYNVTHNLFSQYAGRRLVANLLWNDTLVTRSYKGQEKITTRDDLYDFMVYPWQRTGSLNGDKPGDDSASVLKTKKTSHLSFSMNTMYFSSSDTTDENYRAVDYGGVQSSIFLTENSYVQALRFPYSAGTSNSGLITYYPNIDTILYNNHKGWTVYKDANDVAVIDAEARPIAMKYKSTSHVVIGMNKILPVGLLVENPTSESAWVGIPKSTQGDSFWGKYFNFDYSYISLAPYYNDDSLRKSISWLWLGELYRDVNEDTIFGGKTEEAIRANKWLIGGDAVPIADEVTLNWTHGDTYYQRYDCLKTYPFTNEDENQNTEILSFMCETHVNIDGRYDRNRGLIDNTNISPVNFNMMNPIYSQKDNYFTYSQIDNEANASGHYPNWVTYTQTKQSGADVDEWTHLTLGSTLEMDGDKGEITSLQRFNNQIIAFQDSGISQILYNENAQISTTEGVPIEIANSGKVQGKRYFSDTVGCTNKWSICPTPSGLYFMDSNAKSIYLFNGQLNDLSTAKGFNTWCKKKITQDVWKPYPFRSFVTYYDKQNQDVLFVGPGDALAFSEKIGNFTSFYSYGSAPYFANLDDIGIWINQIQGNKDAPLDFKLFKHREGDYCKIFEEQKPYWMTLVGNPEPQTDKIFTNLEFRACVDGEGVWNTIEDGVRDDGTKVEHKEFSGEFYLPFDYIESWNEYQHGVAQLTTKHGREIGRHYMPNEDYSLKRKFRMWRCDIPRDNLSSQGTFTRVFDDTFFKGRKHYKIDRMRNPWIYLKTVKYKDTDKRTEIHDLVMTYYN